MTLPEWRQHMNPKVRYRSPTRERNIKFGVAAIEKLGKELGINRGIIENAKGILALTSDVGFSRGRSYEYLAVSSLFAAIKQSPTCLPITLSCYSTATQLNRNEIGRVYREIMRVLQEKQVPCSLKPETYVESIVDKLMFGATVKGLELKEMVKARALDILKYRKAASMIGRSPPIVAAVSIYFASRMLQLEFTEETVANTVGCSGVAIRTGIRRFLKVLNEYGVPRENAS